MEQYENPDSSTMSSEVPGNFGLGIQNHQEERVTSSTNSMTPSQTVRKTGGGGAPRLILKSMGKGSFKSTAVPDSPEETDRAPASSSSFGHHLQRMTNLVEDIKTPPVPPPRPRFLTSGVRHFLKPRRSVPPLTPLVTTSLNPPVAEPKPQLSLRDDVDESSSEPELNSTVDLKKQKDVTKNKISQSTLVVSSSPLSQPGIKLHIRREFENSIEADNAVSCEDDLSNSVSSPPVNSDSQNMDVTNDDSFPSAVTSNSNISAAAEEPKSKHEPRKGNNVTKDLEGLHSKVAALISFKKLAPKKVILTQEQPSTQSMEVVHELEGDLEEANEEHFSEPESKQSEERCIKRRKRKQVESIVNDDQEGRPQRKRKPTKHYTTDMVVPRLKIRKKKEISDDEEEVAVVGAFEAVTEKKPEVSGPDQVQEPPLDLSVSPMPPTTPTITRGRGRPRGPAATPSGRGRGRPRGSLSKNKLPKSERIPSPNKIKTEVKTEDKPEDKSDEQLNSTPEITDFVSPIQTSDTELPVEGDPAVNQILSPTIQDGPRKRGRGRGRGSGTPRGSGRGSRGTYTPRGSRGARGTRKSLSPKKEKVSPIKAPPPVQVFEEETRMSADIRPPAPVDQIIKPPSTPLVGLLDEESRASNVSSTSTSTNTIKAKKFTKELVDERKPVTAETMYEYQWPQDDSKAEYYFLQEQISEFLGVKSFRRKYPELQRRVVEIEERDFLRSQKIVSETQCDLGLTAVPSAEVLDILFNDFSEKYEEYRRVVQQKRERELTKSKVSFTPGPVPTVRDRSAEFMRRIMKSCAKWNNNFNRERKEDRSCSFDLQTGTLNFPAGKHKVLSPEATKKGYFPVSVLPGQYCDNFKKYTPTELKYLPLNTVMFGPVCENGNSMESDDSGSETDDSSSSEDSSSSSSEEELTELKKPENGSMEINGDMISNGGAKEESHGVCRICSGSSSKNKDGRPEILIHCAKCDVANHPTCLELTLDMVPFIKKYDWQCTDCKNCIECNDPADEDKMLFCDCCDRGYHIYCVGLRKVPNGRWHCRVCSVCHSCNATEPAPEDRMAEWHHEFKKGEKGYKYYLHSFCASCHKIYKKGQYCPMCLKCHLSRDDKNLLECRNCEKWVHKECVNRPLQTMFGFMCDSCDSAFKARQTKFPNRRN